MQLPEKQKNYQIAYDRALESARGQNPAAFAALGARALGEERYALPVLNSTFVVDLREGSVTREPDGKDPEDIGAGLQWQVPVLHYLGVSMPWPQDARWLAFADIQETRGYESVYRPRVLGRLCGTAGRDEDTFAQACLGLGAEPEDWGDRGFRFQVFPHIPILVAWYRGDDEFPPNATMLYRDNIPALLPMEDVIVLSESLVSRLQGKHW